LRAAPLAVAGAVAVTISRLLSWVPEATPAGVAAALGEEVGGAVAPDEYVWAPSRGAFVDAVWGRDVAFLARTVAEGGRRTPRDVYRARVTVAPGGRPMRVEAVLRETATPLADEHDLIASDDAVAWVVRGEGGEHGATVSVPVKRVRPGSTPGWFGQRSTIDVVFAKPAEFIAIELLGERLLMGVRDGEDEGRALVEYWGPEARVSGTLVDFGIVPSIEPTLEPMFWQRDPVFQSRRSPEAVAAPVDATLFPPPLPWRPIAASPPVVAPPEPAPAAVVRAVVDHGRARLVVTGFDMRQLALRVVPGPLGPPALAGLTGTGRLAWAESERLVATAPVVPVRAARPGALERGRVISPLAVDAPRIAADERGTPSFVAEEGFAPFGAVQTADPAEDEPVVAWCEASTGAVFVAVASPPRKAALEEALAPLSCVAWAWFSSALDAEPRLGGLGVSGAGLPFAAFLRAQTFPEGRKETWIASPGRQPVPAFRPAVLEREELVLGERVRVTAFVADRFSWALRVGSRERSHRAGGSFLAVLEDSLLARAVAAIDVGVGQRKRPNGLTIGGSTGHAYASRGAVLFASERGLALLASADVREDPPEDAVELPLTASAGSPTPIGLKRGLLQERGDICVLPDGTALVALARFDSHAATVEALCRMGCTEVAGLDRGLDVAPGLARGGSEPLASTHQSTRLIALDRGSVSTR